MFLQEASKSLYRFTRAHHRASLFHKARPALFGRLAKGVEETVLDKLNKTANRHVHIVFVVLSGKKTCL